MLIRNLVSKAIVPALLIGAAGVVSVPSAHAANPAGQACVFDKYAPVSVVPYSTDESFSYGSYSFVRGAQLFVPAREGLTKEWLAASVQQALASAHGPANNDPSCSKPDVQNVQVSVQSAGNGFWVALIGRDERAANTLLKWARGLVDRNTHAAR